MYKQLIIAICLTTFLGISSYAGEIHEAAQTGDTIILKGLLIDNPDLINSPDSSGSLPLHLASLNGQLEAVKLLVNAGAEISAGDRDNTTPLICASIGGHFEIIKFLLSHGAKITETDNFDQTALSTASSSGNIELVDYLLDNGADIHHCNNRGRGVLQSAAFRGQSDLIKHLVNRGANLNARDNDSMSVLCAACYTGQTGTIQTLIELGCNVNEAPTLYGHTPLIAAIWNGHLEAVEFLLTKGADLEWRNDEGGTPLHIAAQRGNIEIAQLLIDKGLDVNAVNNHGGKPISDAAWDHAEMVQWLIDHGANLNASDDSTEAPIMSAIYGNNIDAVRVMLNSGASLNHCSQNGNFPFHIAINNGNIELANILLEAGADINVKEQHYNRTPLHFAAINGNSEIAQFLISHNAVIDPLDCNNRTPLYYAAQYGNQSIAEMLKDRGAIIKNIPENYDTPSSLSDTPAESKASIWYLGHSGWGIRTSNHFLIFDYFEGLSKPDKPCLKNGYIDPVELAKVLGDTKIFVFSSHEHGDHYDTTIFGWREVFDNITYVLGHQPENQNGYEYLPPHTDKSIGDIHIWTINSTDAGVGYLIDVDGLTIFHAGDHANREIGLQADYTDEIDYLSELNKPIDMAFLPITGCSLGTPESVKEGVYYALRKLNPKIFYPQHNGTAEYRYSEFAKTAKEDGFSQTTNCAENRGDSFIY